MRRAGRYNGQGGIIRGQNRSRNCSSGSNISSGSSNISGGGGPCSIKKTFPGSSSLLILSNDYVIHLQSDMAITKTFCICFYPGVFTS